jgi:hypothetical protein
MTVHRAFTIGTLAAIGLLAAAGGPVLSQTPSADDVFARFCELDSQGGQLTPDGWQKIAALFVNPGTPRRDKIIVTDDRGGPLRSAPEGGKIGVGREYILFGQIELPQFRFSAVDGLPPGAKIIEAVGIYVVKIQGPGGTEEWRIEGPVPEPHLTVDAAIRYVTKIRANTKDNTIRRNADRTLAALGRFR